jgi:hypothetical protein
MEEKNEQVETADELKDELLEAAEPPSESETEETQPKRNTKQALIDKIIEVSQREHLPMNLSNTKLKRMNKNQLSNVLAELIEEGLRKKMAQQVGVDDTSDRKTIALGALRMLHDVCALGTEKVGNSFLGDHGYEISGFNSALKEPTVSNCIDQCLAEIAAENQDILEYVESPYTRLAIAWGGALALSCRQKNKRNVTYVGPKPTHKKMPVRYRSSRGTTNGKVNADTPPSKTNVKQV